MEYRSRPLKLYRDTSVPNFVFADDAPEKQKATLVLFGATKSASYEFFISGIVLREIEKAPEVRRTRLLKLLAGISVLEFTEEAETLAQAYIHGGALPDKSIEDARHVAVSVINNLDAIVSWNFKHLVNIRRIKSLNLINEEMGYKHIEIISPQEVIFS